MYFKKEYKIGVSGCIGITKTSSGKFTARVKKNGTEINLGSYHTLEEADVVRKKYLSTLSKDMIKTERKTDTGYIGVYKQINKYKSTVTIKKKTQYIGLYNTPEEAHEARQEYLNNMKKYIF